MDNYLPFIDPQNLEAIFRLNKKVIQEYMAEIERYCSFKTYGSKINYGAVLDNRTRLIDLYESCLIQDAHLRGVVETLKSKIIGERYMMAKQQSDGRYIRDIQETKKIQGTQFRKLIEGAAEAKLFGFTGIGLHPEVDKETGRLKRVDLIERRNILPDQGIITQRSGIWNPHWDINSFPYNQNYLIINSGDLGLFSATTPLILAKKFTWSNFINYAYTYGQPIIHGKSGDESKYQELADKIASAAAQRILVTPPNDDIEIKQVSSSNSEQIYTKILDIGNNEVSNLLLGSESMAGTEQSYKGTAQAHQEIFRDRISVYRIFIEDIMNEQIIPRLVKFGFLEPGREFKYATESDMSNQEIINTIEVLSKNYEISPEEIEKKTGVSVGTQINLEKLKQDSERTKFMPRT